MIERIRDFIGLAFALALLSAAGPLMAAAVAADMGDANMLRFALTLAGVMALFGVLIAILEELR